MDYVAQAEGLPLAVQMLEGAPSAPAMGEEEDHGSTPALSTRAAKKKLCLLCQIICKFDLWLNYERLDRSDCLDRFNDCKVWFIDPRVWIIDPSVWIIDPTEFGSLIQMFGSLIQMFGSVIFT